MSLYLDSFSCYPESSSWYPESSAWDPESNAWDPEPSAWNPESSAWDQESTDWDPKSTACDPESSTRDPDPVTGIRNLQCRIRNPRLSPITLNGAMDCTRLLNGVKKAGNTEQNIYESKLLKSIVNSKEHERN